MPLSCEVVVLRHGESSANADGELVGRRDPPLTELGRRQAAGAAEYLVRFGPRPWRVISSPLVRARETAGIAAGRLGVDVDSDDRLVELDYGDLDGTRFADLLAQWPPAWITDPEVAPPGGEPIAVMAARTVAAVAEHATVAAAAGETLLVVTHLGPTKALVGLATGDLVGAQTRVHISPASLTRLRVKAQGHELAATLTALNLVAPSQA